MHHFAGKKVLTVPPLECLVIVVKVLKSNDLHRNSSSSIVVLLSSNVKKEPTYPIISPILIQDEERVIRLPVTKVLELTSILAQPFSNHVLPNEVHYRLCLIGAQLGPTPSQLHIPILPPCELPDPCTVSLGRFCKKTWKRFSI